MTYRFSLLRVAKDPSGYYHARWDKATPLTVIAESEPDAVKKAKAMSGPVYGGRRGDVWVFRVERIDEVAEVSDEHR